QAINGISLGSILLLAALGLSLTFGQMGVINNAHGEFMMIGAYTAYMVQTYLVQGAGASFLLSLLIGFVVAGLLGLLLEATLLARMRGRPLDTLLVTFGVALILQQVARDVFGSQPKDVKAPSWLSGPLHLGAYAIPWTRIFMFSLAMFCLLVVHLVMKLTPLGRQVRATVQNRDLAEASGVSTRRADHVTFFLGSGLAGVAGVALTLFGSIDFNLGTKYIVDAFLVVVAGGVARLAGAVIAAFGLGLMQAFVEYPTSASVAKVVVLLAVVLVLVIRPQGLMVLRTRSLA
ncbi:MAG: urea ABC transporter permease subunit UrtB, partial [Bifidobacteriaceae bacterium]|nr:urea ABC transporter permease subunit UrtB [Bifidobacteriaceae bacterium]